MKDKLKIWVTGGSGFIGHNFIDFLKEKQKQKEQIVLGKKIDGFDIGIFDGDIRKEKDVQVMKDADIIFHFAGPSNIQESFRKSKEYFEIIVGGMVNLLELIRKNSIKRLVSISSIEVYGDAVSINENSNLDPQNPYATSKAAADIICDTYFKMYKTPVVILRLVNQYGPKQNPDKLIPKLIKNVIEKKPMEIFGDGKKYKCWAYVFDTIETIWQAGMRAGIDGQVYNLGGEEVSVIQIAQIISNNMKQLNPKIEFVEDKVDRISVHSFNTKKAERQLGWKIRTPFQLGIKKTIEWYLKNS